MAKNRTLIGIILIVIAIALCFGITPLFTAILEQKTTIIRLKEDIPQGVQVQPSMLEAVEVGTLNLPADMLTNPAAIIGKYTVAAMFTGDTFSPGKLSDTIDSSDTLLRQLKLNETAMSVTIRSFANGLSGKLQQGDIIQIVSVDEENDEQAIIYDELQYVEVLATTADSGSDDTYDTDQVNASEDEENQPDLYATITVICQDRTQALRLAECENTTLHAVFVCRGDSEHKEEYLEAQRSVLGIEQIIAPDTPQNEPADTPDDETETADAPDLDLSAPVEETPKAEESDKSAIVISGNRMLQGPSPKRSTDAAQLSEGHSGRG